jgi:hypothetical protein
MALACAGVLGSTPGCDDAGEEAIAVPPPVKDPIKNASEQELRNVAKELYTAFEPELLTSCGRGCHDSASIFKGARIFLAGPDRYASLKKSGLITEDPTQSALLNQGEHQGPALSSFPELSSKVFGWLRIESAAVEKKVFPTSELHVVTAGPNEIDLSPAGIAGLKIKFDAVIANGLLIVTKLNVSVPAMAAKKGARLGRPLFLRVDTANKLYTDQVDTFSRVNAVFPAGKETRLGAGAAIFSSWLSFQAGDRIRVQLDKVEVGDASEAATKIECKPGAGAVFNTTLGATLGGAVTCTNPTCHGGANRTPSMNLTSAMGQQATCDALANYINRERPEKSPLLLKVTAPATTLGHAGGKLAGAEAATFVAAWTAAIAGNTIWEVR